MKILGLYNNECALELFQWLSQNGHEVVLFKDPLDPHWCYEQKFDLTVSYTYRYIMSAEVQKALCNNVVNLHISYLPFNRGADPNIWCVLEGSPRGVTLHYIDEGLDKGYIISQRIVNCCEEETLSESYNMLDSAARQLFKDSFQYYKYWPDMKKKAIGKGSYHASKEALEIKKLIDTYDISIKSFKSIVLERMEE